MYESGPSSFELPDDQSPMDFDPSSVPVDFRFFTDNNEPGNEPGETDLAAEYLASNSLGSNEDNPMATLGYTDIEPPEPAEPDRSSDLPPPIIPPTDRSEVTSGDEEPRLPKVEADLKWKALHDGDVEIVDNRTTPNSEVLKIYRIPTDTPRTTTLVTPSGIEVLINDLDIVIVYPTDESGLAKSDRPSEVFQGNANAPADYRSEEHLGVDEAAAIEDIRAALQESGGPDQPDILPVIGRPNALITPLHAISTIARALGLSDNVDYTVETPSGRPHEVLIRYPMLGPRTSVITPGGDLIDGRTGDIIEVAYVGPDQGYETMRRTSLSALGNEKGYIRIR